MACRTPLFEQIVSLLRRRPSAGTPVIRLLVLLLVLYGGGARSGVEARASASLRAAGHAQRVIVRLADPPAVAGQSLTDGDGPEEAARLAYRQKLEQQQLELRSRLEKTIPGARVEHRYSLLFNGLAVHLPEAESVTDRQGALAELAGWPEVVRIYEETAYAPALFSSVEALHTADLWARVGGQDQGGAGTRIAVLDSGIRSDHPMLDAAGMTYPQGFPKGDSVATTPKVIAARIYPRAWEPPLAGEQSPIPGQNGSAHGTQLASVAAGRVVQATFRGVTQTVSGIAPRAWLMNYRIFYPPQGGAAPMAYTAEILSALEDAVNDGADVLLLGWASLSPTLPVASPLAEAIDAAIAAGCVVVAPVGNDGVDARTSSSSGGASYGSASRLPGGLARVITVGSVSKPEGIAYDLVDVLGPAPVPAALQGQPFAGPVPTETGFVPISTTVGPIPFLDVGSVAPGSSQSACAALPAGSLAGRAAIVSRGECLFGDKAFYIQQAGAVAMLIVSDADTPESFACAGEHCAPGEITIPVVMIGASHGAALRDWADAHPGATLRLDPNGRLQEQAFPVLAQTSGRGPAYMRTLKPDLVAPGEDVLAASYAPSSGGGVRMTYAQVSGTSVASAHIAGAAALLRQRHPSWGHDQIGAALMATANADIARPSEPGEQASPLEVGAGLAHLGEADTIEAWASPPSVSVPELRAGQSTELEIALRDLRSGGSGRSWRISVSHTGVGQIDVQAPSSVALQAGGTATVRLDITARSAALPGDVEGRLEFSTAGAEMHLPLWTRVAPALSQAEVLLIDNDFSFFEDYADYAHYVTGALDDIGTSYQIWNADAHYGTVQTIPDLNELERYRVVIWITGDNVHPDGYYVLATPLTARDQELLARYLDGGGRLLAMGQNLARASDVNPDGDPRWGRSGLYHYGLGANWLQDSLFDPQGTGRYPPQGAAALMGLPDTFLAAGGGMQNVTLHLGPIGDGAGNQLSIDEIGPGGVRDGTDRTLATPLLYAVDAVPIASGYMGVAKGDDQTLETYLAGQSPVIPYRTVYYSFGFEGINTIITGEGSLNTTTRSELLRRTLAWLLDQVEVTLPELIATSPNALTELACQATSSHGPQRLTYRWKVGGDPVIQSDTAAIDHVFGEHGDYRAIVEAKDALGHTAVAETTVSVRSGGSSTLIAIPASVTPGGEVTLQLTLRNTETQALPFAFTLPVPAQTSYVSHIGGDYAGSTLSWSGTIGPNESYVAHLRVRTSDALTYGAALTASAQIQAGSEAFEESATIFVRAPVFLPLMLKR
ncbi:MAG: S8 family serine peptidase [Anaerolineae bacterium]|nr:S8 family serine peptidase [Anaerolineae bacterium]